jgi:hypothetical protein
MSHLALLKHETQAIKNPPPTFQTVSPGTQVNKGSPPSAEYMEARRGRRYYREKEEARMSEQARNIKDKAIPEWAEGLYYNKGIFSEILVYHDDESIYFEHKGKENGIVRFTFEMIEGLKIVEDEEETANSTE